MAAPLAVHHALDLLRKPILAGMMREQPLPPDVLMLIRVAAGDESALQLATTMTAERPDRVREAAVLYLQHVLMAADADHYRVLGAESAASHQQLREHLGWLMKWLHPDRTQSEWNSAFARRVLAAWEGLKTPERRAAYDRTLKPSALAGGTRRSSRPKIFRPTRQVPWVRQPSGSSANRRTAWQHITRVVTAPLAAMAWFLSSRSRRRS